MGRVSRRSAVRGGGSMAGVSAGSRGRLRVVRCIAGVETFGSSPARSRGSAAVAGWWWWRARLSVRCAALFVFDKWTGRL